MNIAAYCRVSTDKEDQLNSLEAQKKFFTEYTQNNNHNLVGLYADEGISGTKIKNRTEFQRLMRSLPQIFCTSLFYHNILLNCNNFCKLCN